MHTPSGFPSLSAGGRFYGDRWGKRIAPKQCAVPKPHTGCLAPAWHRKPDERVEPLFPLLVGETARASPLPIRRVIGRQELWVEAAPVPPLAPPRAGRSSARERVKSFDKF